ncbi:Uncharacterised protein [Vibrio cholerae]|nr:Uncharacterised protein [Vibrio cholerae]
MPPYEDRVPPCVHLRARACFLTVSPSPNSPPDADHLRANQYCHRDDLLTPNRGC